MTIQRNPFPSMNDGTIAATATALANPVTDQSEAVPRENIRETFESIIVALMLAFVFRAFIVEAFIIPTGSMAPSLYGAHGTIVCEDCGWEFAYGLLDPAEQPRKSEPAVGNKSKALCPNCSHVNADLRMNDDARNAESGDRILVLKWPLAFTNWLLGPTRWDVTVFKNPANGVENYIKRLVGLPNEVLMIVDGDIYTAPASQLSPRTIVELKDFVAQKHLLLSGKESGILTRVSDETLSELDERLTIARKTPEAQEALWFNVYDHDHLPKTVDAYQPRWLAGRGTSSPWDAKGRKVRFRGLDVPPDTLEFGGKSIAAAYAYNMPKSDERQPPVNDQRVRFVFTPQSEQGSMAAELSKGSRKFRATLNMDGRVSITEPDSNPSQEDSIHLETRLSPFSVNRPVAVSFENVDYRLSLHVDQREVLASSTEQGSLNFYGPDVHGLRTKSLKSAVPPRLYGERAAFDISHLVIERDIYYYQATLRESKWSDGDRAWGTTGNPIFLREGEYFMLGDNSPRSQDSRLWGDINNNKYLQERGDAYQLGTVPEDQLIGKAFFVYWPAPQRVSWLPIPKAWGIIPDVGRMRWIR
ncbi:MAG: S26 family signal peptidase [Planctomycetota bacterium]